MNTETKILTFVKGTERFVIRYEPGDESHVLNALVEKANDKSDPFDWYSAAIMSHQLGRYIAAELKTFLPKGVA